ncbi:hypothetical protein CRYUN_Cryun05aG0275600 [Craigia yunnanensis]
MIPPKLPPIRNSSPVSPASSPSLPFYPSTMHSAGSTPPDSPLFTLTTNPSSAGSPLAGEPPSALPCANPLSLFLSPLSLISLSLPIQNSNFNSLFAPSIFLLFTTPVQDQFIQTNQYRAFQFQSSKLCFTLVSIDIVNIGPAFRGHYGSFSPSSALPFLNCQLRSLTAMNEDRNEENLIGMKQTAKDQSELDMCAQGMQIGRLSRLIGPEAVNYTAGLEDLYEKMLSKIESLARLVEASSAKVLEQVSLLLLFFYAECG